MQYPFVDFFLFNRNGLSATGEKLLERFCTGQRFRSGQLVSSHQGKSKFQKTTTGSNLIVYNLSKNFRNALKLRNTKTDMLEQ